MFRVSLLLCLLGVILSQAGQDIQNQIEKDLSLQIVEPKYIAELYQNHSLDYTIANFGAIPYDTVLHGEVVYVHPSDCCQNISQVKAPIYLVDRGNCTFTQKAHFA